MPPQFPTGSSRPSSTTFSSSSAVGGVKRPSLLPAASAPKKIARPASAPCLPALSAPPKKNLHRPTPSLAAPPSAATRPRPRPQQPPAARTAGLPKKTAAGAGAEAEAEAEAAPCRAAESVHPARRLACGTAVYVRTRYYVVIADGAGRCCLLIWLPARVVSSSDAYHCSVKYAADLHAMFAGKIVRVPVADVRVAPNHRPSSAAAKPTQTKTHQQQAP